MIPCAAYQSFVVPFGAESTASSLLDPLNAEPVAIFTTLSVIRPFTKCCTASSLGC